MTTKKCRERNNICVHCRKKFVHIGTLKKHLLVVHHIDDTTLCPSNLKYKCTKCEKRFPRLAQMRHHYLAHVPGNTQGISQLGEESAGGYNFNQLPLTQLKEPILTNTAHLQAPNNGQLRIPQIGMSNHHEEVRDQNGQLPQIGMFENHAEIRNHTGQLPKIGMSNHPEDIRCSPTHKERKRWYAWEHLKTNIERGPFTCDACGSLFKSISGLKGHEKRRKESYACPKCGKQFCTEYFYKKHIEGHEKFPDYDSFKSNIKVRKVRKVRKGVPMHDSIPGIQKIECSGCGDIPLRGSHTCTVTREKHGCGPQGYHWTGQKCKSDEDCSRCKVCVQGFVDQEDLQNHILAHNRKHIGTIEDTVSADIYCACTVNVSTERK